MKSGGILHHTATMYGLTIEKHKRKFIIFIIYFLFHGSVYGQDNSYLIFNHSVSSDTVQLKDRCFENKARTLSEMDYRITEERTGNCRPDSFDDIRTQIEKTDAGSLDPRFVQTQIVGVTTIFLGQHYGGTKFLSRLWYTGAFMLPYFIPTDAQHNLKQNFLAITPALLTLGLFNNYLANESRFCICGNHRI